MYIFTATEFEGELKECNEGTLQWIDKNKILDLPTWEGDRFFFEKMQKQEEFFTMKVEYKGDKLVNCK